MKGKLPYNGHRVEGDKEVKTIYLAGGCFWGIQKFFDQFDGVMETTVGYANGEKENPSYEEVCNNSGHAETVKIVYDEKVLPLKELLGYYFMVIDPTAVNRQGGDAGIQYRTGIYYTEEEQIPGIREVMESKRNEYAEPLAVEVMSLKAFYDAEEYHQKYLDKNPAGYCHIRPEMMKLKNHKKIITDTPSSPSAE